MGSEKKMAIIVLAILAAAPQAGCSLLSVTVGNAIRNSKPAPDPSSLSLVRKRAQMSRTIEAAFGAMEARTDFVMHATSTDHHCEKGENDWKVQTGYAHRCTIRLTRFYGMNGDLRTQMIGFEKLLSTKGWTLPQASITATLTSHYAPFCGSRRLPVFGGGGATLTCSLSQLANPYERYTKDNLQLFIVFADREPEKLHSVTRFGTFDRTEFYNARWMFQEITELYPYALAVAIQAAYFEN